VIRWIGQKVANYFAKIAFFCRPFLKFKNPLKSSPFCRRFKYTLKNLRKYGKLPLFLIAN
jgi:hypothetical protein